MRRPWRRVCIQKWLLLFSLPCVFAIPGSYNSSSMSPSPAEPSRPDQSLCGTPTCSLEAFPYTITYPFQNLITVETQTVVATVIPFVTVLSDGETVTQSSTYLQYGPDASDVVPWSPPQSSQLTWSTLGTVLTFPTTYVAYSPFLVEETAKSRPVAECVTRTTAIPLPRAATAQLVFAQTDRNPTPGSASVFALLDSLPTISAMLDGGNPTDCFQGLPTTTTAFFSEQPHVPPAVISVYTTVSVLTHVGEPVTRAPDPIHGSPGSPTTGIAEPNHAPPPATTTVTPLPLVTAPPPAGTAGGGGGGGGAATVVGGVTITRDAAGGVVVDGVTIPAGAAATVGTVAVSVGSSGAVLVGGSSVDLPTASTTGQHPGPSSQTSSASRTIIMNGTIVDWSAIGCIVLTAWVFLLGVS